MIRIESLSVSFGSFRIEDVSLDVPSGEALLVLGPSGAGKSLLLETVLGIKRPERGKVFIDGVDVTYRAPEERGVAYLPQDVALFPHLSVRENILFGVRARNVSGDHTESILRIVDLLGIGPLLERRDVRTLSGGERQRVALARALMVRPRVLFLDECFSSLDAPIRSQLQEQLRALKRSFGLTVFQVTHDQEEAFLLGDQVAVLMEGRLEQVGTPEDVYARPANLRVARFMLMRNLFRARPVEMRGHHLICSAAGLEFAASVPDGRSPKIHYLGFPPSEVELIHANGTPPPEYAVNLFEARVVEMVNLGHRKTVRLRIDAPEDLLVECAVLHRVAQASPLCVGDRVRVHVHPEAIVCLPDTNES